MPYAPILSKSGMTGLLASGGTTAINGLPATTWTVDVTVSDANAGGRRLVIQILGTSAGRGALAISTNGTAPTAPTDTTTSDATGVKFVVPTTEVTELVVETDGRRKITDFRLLSGGFTATSATWALYSI